MCALQHFKARAGGVHDLILGFRTQEAEAAERADPPMVSTCREIVRTVVDYGVEKDDWKKTWKADAQVSLHIYNFLCSDKPWHYLVRGQSTLRTHIIRSL